ncbi:putative bifunctional diguanylate cyclase/phosphodiesterase [Scytonema sp. NUACC26]|uniref:putative bifunctional diguanylate cyclase/phosphodiesterase n=1 Tax=Scytonema sp. NUACC26 TaxID=3140176 RepID=UPI0034DBE810
MQTSEKIRAEIEETFGFFPPFFEPAEGNVQVLENLWQQTLSAYVNNPLSPSFKEKLSAYLSRYCAVPYCMICHSCSLYALGMKARKVLELLESPPPTEKDIDSYLHILARTAGHTISLSDLDPVLEESLLYCSIFVFSEGEQTEYCRTEVRRLLGLVNYQHLITFVAYVRMCHTWMEAHPEVAYKADKRAIEFLGNLLEEEPSLADFFSNHMEKVRRERQIWIERQALIVERQRNQEALRQAYNELERRVEERTTELSESNKLLQQEISDRQRVEAQLLNIAFHDPLTGLPNRTLFMERLEQTLERTKGRKDLFAVLFLDLDRFKIINDSLGHTIGDRLLKALADRLQTNLRSKDTLARLGGDEFAILIENMESVNDAIHLAERLQQELTVPFRIHGHEVFTTLSIGIALSTAGYELPENLLRDADLAMYRAKASGKARYQIFDTGMYTETKKLLRLETDLRRAVERQEFCVYYQPIVSLSTNKITGFEALLRWQHPEWGLVLPTEFISVAEETGLLVPIGYLVLREACRQTYLWQQQFQDKSLTISVNLSNKQFSQINLDQEIYKILQETGLDVQSLKLEITENVIMENTVGVTAMLSQLRELGVELHMDDFGTGYSSLSYLHRFPVNVLKIDRSFINSSEYSEIVWTIITLAHNLNLDVIAEGIETIEQLEKLRGLQCKYGQGYFFSKPVEASAAEALIGQELRVLC